MSTFESLRAGLEVLSGYGPGYVDGHNQAVNVTVSRDTSPEDAAKLCALGWTFFRYPNGTRIWELSTE